MLAAFKLSAVPVNVNYRYVEGELNYLFDNADAEAVAARAAQAMFDSVPLRRSPDEAGRVYRRFQYGPLLEIFVIDLRSYRGPNTANRQTSMGGTSDAWTAMYSVPAYRPEVIKAVTRLRSRLAMSKCRIPGCSPTWSVGATRPRTCTPRGSTRRSTGSPRCPG